MRCSRFALVVLAAVSLCGSLAIHAAAEAKNDVQKKIVFIAGHPSHGYGAHEHNAGCDLLAHILKTALPELSIDVVHNGWPKDERALEGADAIVMYCDGGGGHMVLAHKQEVDALAKKGTGVVCLHYAVEVPKENGGQEFLDWIGGYFEMHHSVNPHWTAKFDSFPNHPITRGVKPFEINDEWYYHMRFRPDMRGVTPILSCLPPASTLARPDGPHSGNPDVRRAVLENKEPQVVAWASENVGGGRGFGFTGGHDHWNWGDPNFRKLVLNAILWTAKIEVPAQGVSDKPITLNELVVNQDEPVPANLDRAGIRKKIGLPADEADKSNTKDDTKATDGKSTDATKKGDKSKDAKEQAKHVKPAWTSKVVSSETPGKVVDVDVDIHGAKELYLVVTDAGDGISCDWADWCEPRLVGPAGEKKLTELRWKTAESGHGKVSVDKRCDGQEAKIDGKSVASCLGVHANSLVAYELPEGYDRFKARGALDDGGLRQGCGSTVTFCVFTQSPGSHFLASINNGVAGQSPKHEAANAVANLDVAEGLEATLFSSEPQISNITTIDIDAQGRVWAGEVKNYRKWKGSRPEGDRILVLEDTDGDGVCDKQTVFYQGTDIDSVHGICVLGDRVFVSAGDKIQVFHYDPASLKLSHKETLFSGISGTQHDHGIHACVFGPDGKLYFNFGNAGGQIRDRDGKPLVDAAGNEINSHRKPYQEGMAFRSNLDGSGVETLAWNFRNNWELSVDSFGTVWQSDNDDDGNKGVRINYVMEFGNYGYKDELTGAGWNQKRTNWEEEIPKRHWHLNDPGVVPNLLQTGGGSPTGITIYEGTLLPAVFRNQIIHCDAGPSVCRAYPATKSGAGYTATVANVLQGARDNWFRPSDVSVAPDGSLFVADWYDPGVGGHNQQEVDKGRIFRVAPPGVKYTVPKYDYSTADGAAEALKSPNFSVRYLAFTALKNMGKQATGALAKLYDDKSNPRVRARALWLWGQIEGAGKSAVEAATRDGDPDIRVTGIRLARELKLDPIEIVRPLVNDPDPAVRRECAIALRHCQSPEAARLWAELAAKHDGQDRWYLEALGIGADKNWDACLDAYLALSPDPLGAPGGRDIIWRSRAAKTPALLVKIIKDPATPKQDQPRVYAGLRFPAQRTGERQSARGFVDFGIRTGMAVEITAEITTEITIADHDRQRQNILREGSHS